ncbi:hypothetical protein [Bradyrhizobium sp. 23]|uniref:hypothetical protein n=1 Tax=Bradyrhizobium sp. 23 TaxID=2782667 RepID=UPI001FFAC138|nr:hypothetical protein [Bradyrhizobium sp. 23]MCK1313710.1 hypothetical protein [Bradyrhizobium sp. 23]
MWEAVAGILGVAMVLLLFKFGTAYWFPEKGARLLLRREVRNRGVDVSAIPDPAWDEMVSRSVALAKLMAPLQKANWRLVLVDFIELDAAHIAAVMSGRGGQECEMTKQTLVKFGVKSPIR